MSNHNNNLNLKQRQNLIGFLFTLPFIAGFVLFFIAPFLVSIRYTFTFGTGKGRFVGLENYFEVINSEAFKLASHNTFRFMLIGIPLIMLISTLLALLLQHQFKGSSLFRCIFIFPLVVPIASTIMVFQIFFAEFGLLNTILTQLGLPVHNWLQSEYAFHVLVGLYIWKNSGYNMILLLSGLNAIPKSYYETASIEGCSKIQAFRYITLPLMMPTFFFVFVISIINSFKCFREAFLLGGRHPHNSIYMLQHFMNNNFENLNYQRLSVAAILIFITIFSLIYVLFALKKRQGDIEL